MPASASATVLLVLLQALVPILVVDLAEIGVRQRLVGISDLDELVVGGVVVGVFVRVILFGEGAIGALDFALRGGFVEAEEGVIVLCGGDEGAKEEDEEDG